MDDDNAIAATELTFSAPSVHVFLGPIGCGKSTAARAVCETMSGVHIDANDAKYSGPGKGRAIMRALSFYTGENEMCRHSTPRIAAFEHAPSLLFDADLRRECPVVIGALHVPGALHSLYERFFLKSSARPKPYSVEHTRAPPETDASDDEKIKRLVRHPLVKRYSQITTEASVAVVAARIADRSCDWRYDPRIPVSNSRAIGRFRNETDMRQTVKTNNTRLLNTHLRLLLWAHGCSVPVVPFETADAFRIDHTVEDQQ
jgi:hypothetical protein